MANALKAAQFVPLATAGSTAAASLAVVPLLLFAFIIHRTVLIAPLFAGLGGFDYDPAYVYLLSGLSLADFHGPKHVDHPGIATQLLMALYLSVSHLLDGILHGDNRDLYAFVRSQPERLLLGFGYVCSAILSIIIAAIGIRVHRATQTLLMAIAVQATFLLIANQLVRLGIVNGETTGLLFGAALFYLLIPIWLQDHHHRDPSTRKSPPVLMGICCAGMLASKITFAPLVLMLLVIESPRRLLLSVGSLIVTVVLLFLPIGDEILRLASWLYAVMGHSGNYGGGDVGFIDWSKARINVGRIVDLYPASFLVVALSIVLAGATSLSRHSMKIGRRCVYPQTRFLWVALAAFGLQFLIVVKHFGEHYYVPSLLISAMLMASCLLSIVSKRHGRSVISAAKRWGTLSVFAMTIVLCLDAVITKERVLQAAKPGQLAVLEAWQEVQADYPDAVWISVYRAASPVAAQAFALGYVETSVAARYRGGADDGSLIALNRWNGLFLTGQGWQGNTFVEELSAKGAIVLIHAPANFDIATIDLALSERRVMPDGSKIFQVDSGE